MPGVYVDLNRYPLAGSDLDMLLQRGVTSFLIQGAPSRATLYAIEKAGGTVIIAMNNRFPVDKTVRRILFENPAYVEEVSAWAAIPPVTEVIVFWGPFNVEKAFSRLEELMTQAPLYVFSCTKLAGQRLTAGYRYHEIIAGLDDVPARTVAAASYIVDTSLFRDKNQVSVRTAVAVLKNTGKPVFVDSNWLLTTLKSDPLYGIASTVLPEEKDWIPEKPQGAITFISAVLALVWLVFAVLFYNDPTYRKSIHRFFVNHTFFARDVINKHIRLSQSSWTITASSMVLVGLMMESVFQFLIEPTALEVLKNNISLVQWASNLPFGFFTAGVLLQLGIVVVSLLWLRFSLPNVREMVQFTPIYAFTFHIHLAVIPLVIVLSISGSSLALVMSWGVISMFALTFLSYYITAIDFTQTNPRARRRIFFTTIIPFTALVVIVALFLFYQTPFGEAVRYASSVG